jgi:hypothetical protein
VCCVIWFKECEVKLWGLDEQYEVPTCVAWVTSIKRGDWCMDIISSVNFNVISPIFSFHLTIVFNWITADSLFSAYPKLTCTHRGLLNLNTFSCNQFVPVSPPASFCCCLKKYYEHGLNIQQNPSCTKFNVADNNIER